MALQPRVLDLADAIEALSEGFALFDEERRLLLCNGQFLRMNPTLADLIAPGVGWDLLLREATMRGVLDDETARRLRWLESRLEPGAAPESVEVEAPNGTVGAVTLSATRSDGFVITQRDVTARRQPAANEQEAAQILHKALEACPANVVMSRVGDGQVLYRTPAATELLGAAMTLSDHFASREERADFITALLPTGRADDMDVTCLHADGSAFPASISARLIEYRGEDVVASAIADLTRETAMQDELAGGRRPRRDAARGDSGRRHLAAHRQDRAGRGALHSHRQVVPGDGPPRARCAIAGRPERGRPGGARRRAGGRRPDGLTAEVEARLDEDLPTIMAGADQIAQVVLNVVGNADQAIAGSGVGGRIEVSSEFRQRRDPGKR